MLNHRQLADNFQQAGNFLSGTVSARRGLTVHGWCRFSAGRLWICVIFGHGKSWKISAEKDGTPRWCPYSFTTVSIMVCRFFIPDLHVDKSDVCLYTVLFIFILEDLFQAKSSWALIIQSLSVLWMYRIAVSAVQSLWCSQQFYFAWWRMSACCSFTLKLLCSWCINWR